MEKKTSLEQPSGVLTRMGKKAKMVEPMVKQTIEAARAILKEDPKAIPGWKLQERKTFYLVPDKPKE